MFAAPEFVGDASRDARTAGRTTRAGEWRRAVSPTSIPPPTRCRSTARSGPASNSNGPPAMRSSRHVRDRACRRSAARTRVGIDVTRRIEAMRSRRSHGPGSPAAVVVTGGSKGMGLAIADDVADEGAKVAVMARRREALDARWRRCVARCPRRRRNRRRHVRRRVDRRRVRRRRAALGSTQQPGSHHRAGRRLLRGDERRGVG